MIPGGVSAAPNSAPSSMRDFYDEMAVDHLLPLWEHLHALVPRSPASATVPAKWDYRAVIRPYLFRAGELVTAEKAERRVLVLENPGLVGSARVTQSLYAGIQLVKPGETARAHRHTQSALRLVIEGAGAYTAVDGERVDMYPGDLILTPSWRWHDHGNDSSEPIVWLDVLDVPIVEFFGLGFAEPNDIESQAELRPRGDSDIRYAHNLFPVDWTPSNTASPILRYPYDRTCEILARLARDGDPDPHHGHKLRFINPATGGFPMPTLAIFVQQLSAGFETSAYRSTESTVFLVVEGEGESRIGGATFAWKPHDVLVVPTWQEVVHRSSAKSILFSVSDKPIQQSIGLWREQRGGSRSLGGVATGRRANGA